MIEAETINGELAIVKLNELQQAVNTKLGLPENECQERIRLWQARANS